AFVAGPRGDAAGDQRTVDPTCELLQTREQARASDEQRNRLQDAQFRIALHAPYELEHRLRGHQTVRVQHDHVVVAAAPTLDELLDVAGFAPRVVPPPPIPHGHDVA